ncbi:MAG: sulfurtransferase TusA family protein [Deltaproteobacteria bacterium]|nr:sulfurtransferase TusA family protein [Deltaproteobacteria bacterium]
MDERQEIERVAAAVEKFRTGALGEVQLRAIRVPMGVYEQREPGTYMLRVRCPAGVLEPAQLVGLARTAACRGTGLLHVTSRQGVQVHGVPLDGIVPALRDLAAAGLSTRGSGGNSVRNVTACESAGVCPDEAFDVSPLARRLTALLLSDPAARNLPRKFKVGLAGCGCDCGGALANDLAFVARLRDGVPGFAAYAGGGMGAGSRIADPLKSFVPVEELDVVAVAVMRVFARFGNRKDKRRARLRFLVAELGAARFRELVRAERSLLHTTRPIPEPAVPDDGIEDFLPTPPRRPCAPERAAGRPPEGDAGTGEGAERDFARWRSRSVLPQKQPGLCQVTLPLPLGDLEADRALALAPLAARFGDGLLRATQEQNLLLRSVREQDLPGLHQALGRIGLGEGAPPVLRDLVSCAGADWCKLGLCRSRGLAAALADRLESSGLDLDALGSVRIAVDGCPDSCGRHPLADIALVGAARRVAGRLVPHYELALGGRLGEGRTRLARRVGIVPARDVPDVVVELLAAWRESGTAAGFRAFVDGEDEAREAALAALHTPRSGASRADDLAVDWGAREPFSLAGRGPGECGAGVMDLIEVDLASAAEALRSGRLLAATALAARALLVTRGEQPESDVEGLRAFEREFLEHGPADPRFRPLVRSAIDVAAADPDGGFAAAGREVEAFVDEVRALYGRMDGTLGFPAAEPVAAEVPAPVTAPSSSSPAEVRDFRGVVCPLNYAKTRLALSRLANGQVLAVLLDAAGARNVPASAAADGQQVLGVMAEGDAFRVLIRKVARP